MAKCKDCFHCEICAKQNRLVQIDAHTWDEYELLDDVEKFCEHFKNTADVAPRAEVERLQKELDVYKTNALSMAQTMPNMARAERQEVAREIFAELRKRLYEIPQHHFALIEIEYLILELKKKYTEVQK